jgi:hypothetical protein
MPQDDRNLVEVLKAELLFIENGGYRDSPRALQKPQFIFEDSPTCINHDSVENPRPCSECALMRFVPVDCRNEKIPCRHIVLNAHGYCIDTYYRLGTQEEVEAAVAVWLRGTIQQLERERDQEPKKSSDALKAGVS